MNGRLITLNDIIKAGVACFAIKAGVSLFALKKTIEEDAKALFLPEEKDYSFIARVSCKFNYKKDWIIDSGCAAHLTGHIEKLQNLSDLEETCVVVLSNGSTLSVTHVGSTIVSLKSDNYKMPLQPVYQVSGTRNNVISVSQLTSSGYFVLFGPQDVKLYHKLEVDEEPVMKGRMLNSIYVLDDVKMEN